MLRLLAIVPGKALRGVVLAALGHLDYQVEWQNPTPELHRLIVSERPDGLILDVRAMAANWLEECKAVRRTQGLEETAIVLIFPAATFVDVAADAEIDDFLVIPFEPAELRVRVRRALKRTIGARSGHIIRAGGVVIDQEKFEVRVKGRPLVLTLKEYELLRFLVSHPDRTFPRRALLNRVWGYDYLGGTRTVDVHVRRLRAKLGSDLADTIRTVRGVGYRFSPAGEEE